MTIKENIKFCNKILQFSCGLLLFFLNVKVSYLLTTFLKYLVIILVKVCYNVI